jgi:hypothetical protein
MTDLTDSIYALLNQNLEEGGDPMEQLTALSFCITDIAIDVGILHEDFARHMYKCYARMEIQRSMRLENITGGKNANH